MQPSMSAAVRPWHGAASSFDAGDQRARVTRSVTPHGDGFDGQNDPVFEFRDSASECTKRLPAGASSTGKPPTPLFDFRLETRLSGEAP
jgi:hypothetical protein